MRKAIDIIAKTLSIILYPLFVPTYGVALFCRMQILQEYTLPAVWIGVAIVGTFVLTCALPLSAIYILIRKGEISDIQMANSSERTMPYIYTIGGLGFWCYLMIAILEAPVYIGFVCVGATLAILIVAIINRWWKISAHLTGLGGLFGGLISYCMGTGAIPTWWLLCIWAVITLLLMYSRLWLNAHSATQVTAGWLLGIACTFVPYSIYYYVYLA